MALKPLMFDRLAPNGCAPGPACENRDGQPLALNLKVKLLGDCLADSTLTSRLKRLACDLSGDGSSAELSEARKNELKELLERETDLSEVFNMATHRVCRATATFSTKGRRPSAQSSSSSSTAADSTPTASSSAVPPQLMVAEQQWMDRLI